MERAVARIDLGAVRDNCARLKAELGPEVELCAVVKADGYGHGDVACAEAALAGGATRLAVATAAEAERIGRRFAHVSLLTMGALAPAELDMALEAGSEVAVWRRGFLDHVAARASAHGRPARVHVKHDSGMGRLGNPDPAEVLELLRACAESPGLEPVGVWTHFATADEPDSGFFDEQLDRFAQVAEAAKAEFPGLVAHAANSAALFRERRSHFDMARCGVAVYGLDPFQGDPAEHGLRPALSLRSYVADVKPFVPGDSVGYGQTWRAERETRVGVLPLGYGDGVRRGLSNNAEVLVGGRRYPLVGTVSMDNVTVDLGVDSAVEPGAEAVLIGAQGDEAILAEEVAGRLGTINYEVTCGISARVPRVQSEPR
jgi:alanine racemase